MSDLTLAVAQSIAQPGNLVQSIQDHRRLAQRAAEQGAQIVVFPELSLTGYDRGLTASEALSPADARLQPLQALADKHNMLIIAGAPILSPAGLHIGALNFVPHAGIKTYLKQYLHEGEEVAFCAGQGGDALQIGGQTVCVAICAEITQAQHAQAAAACGARIYAASCFITPAGYTHDAGLLQGYARQHRMTVLLANYGAATGGWPAAGRSAIWSNEGTLLVCAPDAGEAVIVARLCKGV